MTSSVLAMDTDMTATRKALVLVVIIMFMSIHVYGHNSSPHRDRLRFQASLIQSNSVLSNSPSPTGAPGKPSPLVYDVTSYGADPTGVSDSTESLLGAISDALNGSSNGFLFEGIVNLGGAEINLQGGNYLISRPLQFPVAGRGNLVVSLFVIVIRSEISSFNDESQPLARKLHVHNFAFMKLGFFFPFI